MWWTLYKRVKVKVEFISVIQAKGRIASLEMGRSSQIWIYLEGRGNWTLWWIRCRVKRHRRWLLGLRLWFALQVSQHLKVVLCSDSHALTEASGQSVKTETPSSDLDYLPFPPTKGRISPTHWRLASRGKIKLLRWREKKEAGGKPGAGKIIFAVAVAQRNHVSQSKSTEEPWGN